MDRLLDPGSAWAYPVSVDRRIDRHSSYDTCRAWIEIVALSVYPVPAGDHPSLGTVADRVQIVVLAVVIQLSGLHIASAVKMEPVVVNVEPCVYWIGAVGILIPPAGRIASPSCCSCRTVVVRGRTAA